MPFCYFDFLAKKRILVVCRDFAFVLYAITAMHSIDDCEEVSLQRVKRSDSTSGNRIRFKKASCLSCFVFIVLMIL